MKIARLVLYVLIGLCFGANFTSAHAAAYQSYQGSAYRNINGTTYWKGDSGSVSESRARVLESVRVGGTYVGVPHIGEVGAAAATAIIAAVRSTPGALVGSALLSWMLSKGFEYIDGEWKKKNDGPSVPLNETATWSGSYITGTISGSLNDALVASTTKLAQSNGPYNCPNGAAGTAWCPNPASLSCSGGPTTYTCNGYAGGQLQYTKANPVTSCPPGYASSAGACFPTGYSPVLESDWDQFNGVTPPDAVMNDICKRLYALDGKGCRMTSAGTQTATAPLSDYYTDASGDTVRQVAKVSPAPTADDPFRTMVETQTEKQKTTTDPTTGETTTTTETSKNENEDFCTLHPNALACQELGEPPDSPELEKKDVPVSLTPDAGWGASGATCPADLTYTTHKGIFIKLSWSPVCQMANTFRPVVIGIAWLTAVMLFMGISRRVS